MYITFSILFFFCNLVSPLPQTWICCTRWSGIHQMEVWEDQWKTPLTYLNFLSRSPPPPTSQNMNSRVTVATTFWWTPPPWPVAITFVVTVWLCGGNPLTRKSAQSAGRNGKAFLKSTYFWGMLFTARSYQGWMFDFLTTVFLFLSHTVEDREPLTSAKNKKCVCDRCGSNTAPWG